LCDDCPCGSVPSASYLVRISCMELHRYVSLARISKEGL
jgi:hypothetical protein